jgi:hypothetical protein
MIGIRSWLAALIIELLAIATAAADDAVTKVRDIRRDDQAADLYVVFCARDSPGPGGFPGHAYVALQRDDAEAGACVIEAFGFQPANEGDKGIVKAVPGSVVEPYVKDHKKPLPGVCRLILRVDRSQYRAVEAVRRKWTDREYSATGANCIDFADDAARALGLSRPRRSVTQRPRSYMRQLTERN